MENKTCCFTGHRKLPANEYQQIANTLKTEIEKLIEQGVTDFMAGGALGFDTLAAQIVLELRKTHSQITLILIFPCKTQTYNWSEKAQEVYELLKNACDKYLYLSDSYTKGCMHQRNRYLVEHSKYCICYLTKETGGTAYTVRYAQKKGLTIIHVAHTNTSANASYS